MKKILAILFAALVTMGALSIIATMNFVSADTEPNNNFDQAELILPGTYSGSLIGSDTADVYKFNVTGGQTITIKFTSSVTGNWSQQMGLHNQTQNDVLHLSSKNNVTNTGTYNVDSSVGTVYFYIMVNVGPPGQEAKGNYSFQLQVSTEGNETETAALAATWLKELSISPQTDGNFCGMNAYDLQLDGWGTDPEIRNCILSQGVSGFYSNTTVYNRAIEILNGTFYNKTKWMVDGGMGLSRNVASVFAWNLIQPTKGGGYYFSVPDMSVSSAQSMNANTIGSIMPIAIWDQHDAGNMPINNTIQLYQNGSFFCIGNTTGPIGNLSAYADFIKATVERYDCDGISDMPGLKYGIKYWEVWNEPESPGGGFKSKPWNYTQLLNATYNAVKSACADAIVVSGGALEVYNLTITQQFWKDVFAFGGGNYFDIMNIHYNTERNEQAHTSFTQYNWTLEFFRNLTSSYGMLKPMWITEIGTYTGTPLGYGGYLPYQSEQFQASWMAKHYVYGLEKNVTKFFWDLQVAPGDSVFFTNEGKCQLCYYTHKLMIYKIDNFTSVEKLAEGQYKFVVSGKNIYVLWGNGSIPGEITGTVNVTNIFGNVTQTSATSIVLSDEPIFVEVLSTSNVSESSHFGYLGNIQGLGVLPPQGGVPWSDALYRPIYPTYFSPFDEVGFKWDRPHPGPFNWNITERTKGVYNWSLPDDYVKQAQQHGVQIIATIWPYVEWDQAYWKTQPGWNGSSDEWLADIPSSRYKPNDTAAYKNFVQTMVERYDGDGASDMPGLQYPVKYWEILNEPESGQATGQGAEKAFFRGTVVDYMDVLNETGTAIWAANPNAYIVNGGAGADLNSFWTNVLDSGGSQYFDIGNWHYLAQPAEMGDLNTGTWLNLFNPYGITRVWCTEYSIFVGQKPGSDVFITEQDQAERFVKGHVQAFAAGAEKIFYIMFSQKDCGLINSTNNQTRPSYYAAKTIIQKLDYFTAVGNISDGNKRAYKFTVNGSYVYVLWGSGSVPSEITGNVKVTNIFGNITQTSASSIILSDEPVFVEGKIPSNAGLNFTADAGIRVSGGSVPCIVQLPSGVYRLFYTYNGEIYSASSTDGLDFTVDSGKRVAKGGDSDPDRDSASSPVLIQFGENSFVLFYEGSSGSAHVVLSANSTDGLNFTKQSEVRYSGVAADGGIVSAFDIIKESTTFLRMYYVGDWFGKNNVRTAFSNDGGNTWTFEQGNICGDDDAGGGPNTYIDPDIVKLPSGGYKLYTKKGADKIYSFSSTDGLHFTQDAGVRLQASQFSGLGVTELLDPDTIILPNGSMRMFCGAGPAGIVSALATYIEEGAAVMTAHDPIYINGNSNFTSANGVSSGNGTAEDPYIIENWDINASGACGIEIKNTDKYFIIRNCVVHDGYDPYYIYNYGIFFYNATNGGIDNVTSYNNYLGICLSSSSNNNITNCAVYNNSWYGIELYSSPNNQITNCDVYNNSWGIKLYSSSNTEIHHNNIYNNTAYGVYNYNTESEYSANATYNWWGSSDGPGGVGPGNGDNVSANVLYEPWLTEPWTGGPINQPQTVNITYPTEGQTVNGTITINGTANDPEYLGCIVEIKIDEGDWQLAGTFDYVPYASWFYDWNTTTEDNGWHTIYARAYDGIDYSEIKSVNVNVSNPIPDTEPPQISNVNDIPDPQEVNGYVYITCTVTDNAGINVVKVNITYPNGETKNITMMQVGDNSYSYNASYSVLGSYSYYIWADDIKGNQNKSATYQFIITTPAQDTTKPGISNVQAAPSTQTQGGAVNITCTVTDVAVDNVYVDITGPAGFTPINITMTKIQDTDNYYYNSTYSIPGEYYYYIWANDTSNNQNISSAYQFNITVSAVPVPISVVVKVDDRDINITAFGTGTINVASVALPQAPPENLHYIGIRINVTITGTFTYANITIKYNDSDVTNIDDSELKMYYWDEPEGKWKQCEKTGVDIINNIVWANITHLTIFAPMAEKVSEVAPAAPANLFLCAGIAAVIVILAVSLIVIVKRRKKLERAG